MSGKCRCGASASGARGIDAHVAAALDQDLDSAIVIFLRHEQ